MIVCPSDSEDLEVRKSCRFGVVGKAGDDGIIFLVFFGVFSESMAAETKEAGEFDRFRRFCTENPFPISFSASFT